MRLPKHQQEWGWKKEVLTYETWSIIGSLGASVVNWRDEKIYNNKKSDEKNERTVNGWESERYEGNKATYVCWEQVLIPRVMSRTTLNIKRLNEWKTWKIALLGNEWMRSEYGGCVSGKGKKCLTLKEREIFFITWVSFFCCLLGYVTIFTYCSLVVERKLTHSSVDVVVFNNSIFLSNASVER